jgi:hypothetical protein
VADLPGVSPLWVVCTGDDEAEAAVGASADKEEPLRQPKLAAVAADSISAEPHTAEEDKLQQLQLEDTAAVDKALVEAVALVADAVAAAAGRDQHKAALAVVYIAAYTVDYEGLLQVTILVAVVSKAIVLVEDEQVSWRRALQIDP